MFFPQKFSTCNLLDTYFQDDGDLGLFLGRTIDVKLPSLAALLRASVAHLVLAKTLSSLESR